MAGGMTIKRMSGLGAAERRRVLRERFDVSEEVDVEFAVSLFAVEFAIRVWLAARGKRMWAEWDPLTCQVCVYDEFALAGEFKAVLEGEGVRMVAIQDLIGQGVETDQLYGAVIIRPDGNPVAMWCGAR